MFHVKYSARDCNGFGLAAVLGCCFNLLWMRGNGGGLVEWIARNSLEYRKQKGVGFGHER